LIKSTPARTPEISPIPPVVGDIRNLDVKQAFTLDRSHHPLQLQPIWCPSHYSCRGQCTSNIVLAILKKLA